MKDGDVLSYTPDQSRFSPRWCREGMAVVRAVKRTDGERLLALDTYWHSGDEHVLLPVELGSASVLFNLADVRPLERNETYTDFAPGDRFTITHQHGLQRDHYVRLGALPHYPSRVRAQVELVRARRAASESAARAVEWAEKDLRRLLDERVTS